MDTLPTLPPQLDFQYRASVLRQAPAQRYDLLVIGGGINGAGIAYDAAQRGFSVLLVERADFASGTSSRSSKLIHGGIRYLKNMEFGLVFEALRERALLLKLCPHIVRPLRFLYPIYRGDPDPAWTIKIGMTIYDLLSMFQSPGYHESLSMDDLRRLEPGLSQQNMLACPRYYDAWMNDARLVFSVIQSAVRSGAEVLNYAEVRSLMRDGDELRGAVVVDRLTGQELAVEARLIVNAAGPWLDRVASLERGEEVGRLQPTKGVHLLIPKERFAVQHAVVLHAPDDGRVLFAIPWERMTLIGTTDTFFKGEPSEVYADREDVAYLLRAVNQAFPQAALEPKDVRSTYAGLRPLVGQSGKGASQISREHEIFVSPGGLLSIGGGKYTTFRAVAREVVERAAGLLQTKFGLVRRKHSYTDRFPLEGGALDSVELEEKELEQRMQGRGGPEVARHLVRNFGRNGRVLVEEALRDGASLEPMVPGFPYTLAEFRYAARYEMLGRLEDLLIRRSQLHLEAPGQGLGVAEAIAAEIAPLVGWSRARIDEELALYEAEVRRARACLEAPSA